MKYFKMTFALVAFLFVTNLVIAQGQRTVANPGASVEARSVEDIVKNSNDFVSVTPGSNARKMSSTSSVKNKAVATLTTGLVQLQSNNKDVVKKYNRFSDKEGEMKNRKNR